MSWKDRAKDVAQKSPELATTAVDRAKVWYETRQAQAKRARESDDAILRVMSRDEGRNAVVTLYADRIERVQDKAFGSLSRARQDIEVTPIRAVTSLQAKKAGLRTIVTLFAGGNSIDFRIARQDAQRFSNAVTKLMVAPPPAPALASAPGDVADQIRKLAELRDQGILSEAEFQAKKQALLGL